MSRTRASTLTGPRPSPVITGMPDHGTVASMRPHPGIRPFSTRCTHLRRAMTRRRLPKQELKRPTAPICRKALKKHWPFLERVRQRHDQPNERRPRAAEEPNGPHRSERREGKPSSRPVVCGCRHPCRYSDSPSATVPASPLAGIRPDTRAVRASRRIPRSVALLSRGMGASSRNRVSGWLEHATRAFARRPPRQ